MTETMGWLVMVLTSLRVVWLVAVRGRRTTPARGASTPAHRNAS